MGLTRLAIARPVVILMLVGAFLVLGLIGFSQLPEELNPPVEFPTITVRTNYTGTNPQEMETLITKPIEDSIAGVSGIQEIDSTSQEGVSNVRIQFYYGTDLNSAEADVIQKVDAIRSSLPQAASSPSVVKADTNGQPVLGIAMQSPTLSQQQLQTLATNVVQPALEQGTDVGEVDVSAVSTREIHVDLDPARLSALGVTIPQIVSALNAANVNVASGFIQSPQEYYNVRLIGEFASVAEIKNLRLSVGSGGSVSASSTDIGPGVGTSPAGFGTASTATTAVSSSSSSAAKSLYLSDVATVTDTTQEKTTDSFFDGGPAVTINVLKTTDGNTVAAVASCLAELKQVQKYLPRDVAFTVINDQSKQVTENVADVVTSLFLGAFLAILVVYAFLHNARGTLIIAIAIPTSMIATFLPMWALGFTLNTESLLGLSLAVGILVDDSIVVLENINRHLQLGEEPVVAAINGRTEIGLAALVLTSVDLVVFLPIAFMGGVIGEFFRSFGVTVAVATLFSLFVSFTLTPMLAARWYRKGESLEAHDRFSRGFDRGFQRIEAVYERMLGWSIRHPWVVVGASSVLIVLVFVFIGGQLGFRFSPDQDQGQVTIFVQAPAGSSVYYTEGITRQIESIIHRSPDLASDVQFVSTQIGNGGPGQNVSGPQYAHVDLTLYDRKSVLDTLEFWKHAHLRDRADTVVARELAARTKRIIGAQIFASNVSGFGGRAPLSINLTGPDLNSLVNASNQVVNILNRTNGVYNVNSSFQTSQPEVDIKLDRTKAPEYGLSLDSVASALSAAVAGDTTVKYRDPTDGQQYNLRIELSKQYRNDPQAISSVTVAYANGAPIKLGDVAQVTIGTGPVKIDRLNRERTVAVSAYLLPGYSVGRVSVAVMQRVQALHLSQVTTSAGGETQSIQREGGYLLTAFLLGIILTYMLMAALFNNVVYPFSIMLSLPQAWAGGLIALWIAGEQLSLISMIGVVLLNAIVNKNAILLVDYTNTLRGRGYKREDALQLAGPTRLRPIMMTTFTILVSTLPTALALGRGAQFRQSLGVVVEGGITLSLLLTLLVVPSAYVIYDNLTEGVGKLQRRWAKRQQLSRGMPTGGSPDTSGAAPPVLSPAPLATSVLGGDRDGRGEAERIAPLTGRGLHDNGNGNGRQNGSGQGPGHGDGKGKYGRLIIRNRRPDELYERQIKGDGRGDPRRN